MRKNVLYLILIIFSIRCFAQEHSIVRRWNEVLLEAIRNDFARPTVHARNLFHISASMYDSWSAFDDKSIPYLFNRNHKNGFFPGDFSIFQNSQNIEESRKTAISYAAYRMITHRFSFSPGTQETLNAANDLMNELGFDTSISSTDYSDGSPAKLGNFIADSYINYGLTDGSNEEQDYINFYYKPVNPPLVPTEPGNPLVIDMNRWQPLFFDEFIDQSGNSIPSGVIDFLSPEWGNVLPFSLQPSAKKEYLRDEHTYKIYHDPGEPPYLNSNNELTSEQYKWGFSMVSIWGSHLASQQMIDISPSNFGNVTNLPLAFQEYDQFYNYIDGGDISQGHEINPRTMQAYEPNEVPLGDYTRVLAEFWADGPDSETPPGHWFTILNYVMDHELFIRKFEGIGDELGSLEYEVKAYFILGGAMHDAAVSSWSIKGWYDYLRPISAIRGMADFGQSSDINLDSYHENGIPLVDGYIELVENDDPLAGDDSQHVGKIKLYTWRGHDYINDPSIDEAGVGWILAENWWPYQRPTFVTPPFAGYISGHSTFSRAAAEILTSLTGDPFFPGGMGEFIAKKDEFLVFENGPSVDVKLQWATYRDASDQTSLSRIWGGIHPPADDIPGRIIGEKIGKNAFSYAQLFFNGIIPLNTKEKPDNLTTIYPNPIKLSNSNVLHLNTLRLSDEFNLFDLNGKLILQKSVIQGLNLIEIPTIKKGMYIYKTAQKSGRLVIQ